MVQIHELKIQELKRATPRALRDINHLLLQLSKTAKHLSLKELKGIVKSKDNCLVVAKDGDRIIGMGTLIVMETVVGIRARIEDVVVDEKYRGRRIGEKISRKLITLAKRKKVKSIELSSRPSRIVANKLYKKLGFKRRDTNVYNLPLQ